MVTADALNALSKQVLDAAFTVHTELGPGLLESTYVACLKYELELRGLEVRDEVPVPIIYKGQRLLDVGYRMDLLVQKELIVETKSVEGILPVHKAQLLSYLKHSERRLGLLLNFNTVHLRDGIVRVVNKL